MERRTSNMLMTLAVVGIALLALSPAKVDAQASGGTFAATGSMKLAREWATATLLSNGKVLVAGGNYFQPQLVSKYITNTAEVYDPVRGIFHPVGSMTISREFHTATLLQNGKVLITGGIDKTGLVRGLADLFDPSTNKFTRTGNMILARNQHTATLLNNGQVLIAGGFYDNFGPPTSGGVTNTAELYDPATGTFTSTGNLTEARADHTATLLQDGSVLIGGGDGTAEIYNPTTGTFARTGNMTTVRSFGFTATELADGEALFTGGTSPTTPNSVFTSEFYNPSAGSFIAGPNMVRGRLKHTASLLPSGEVLLAGGFSQEGCGPACGEGVQATAEVYDPTANTFTATGNMTIPRESQMAVTLNTGKVLVTGGDDGSNVRGVAELYTP